MKKTKLETKLSTKMIMGVAKVCCKVWAIGRSLRRGVSDFDYHIFDLRSQFPNEVFYKDCFKDVPFFNKEVEDNTSVAKTSNIKIGDCNIKYTVTRVGRMTEEIPTIGTNTKRVQDLLSVEDLLTQTRIHHNNPNHLKVVAFKRKDSDVVKMHDK